MEQGHMDNDCKTRPVRHRESVSSFGTGRLFRHSTMKILRCGCFLVVFWSSVVDGGKIYPPGIFIEADDAKPIFKPYYQPRKLFIEPRSTYTDQRNVAESNPVRHSNSENAIADLYSSEVLSSRAQRRIKYYSFATEEPVKSVPRSNQRHLAIIKSQNSDIWNTRLPTGCYQNENGYLCCNKQLEQLIKDAVQRMTTAADAAEEIQKVAKETFGRQFETIVAPSDFAYKINFARTFICKVEVNGQFALAYGLPK